MSETDGHSFCEPDENDDRSLEEAAEETDALLELPESLDGPGGDYQGAEGEEPARGPVEVPDVDPLRVKELLGAPIKLGATLIEDVDPFVASKLVAAAVDIVVARAKGERSPTDGISLAELADRSGIGSGRIGEHVNSQLQPFANIATRGVYAQAGRRVYFEEFASHRTEVGRRHNGVGTDKNTGDPRKSLHLADHYLGASDRHCPATSDVLVTGTRWDSTSDRFGVPLPDWAKGHLDSLPRSIAEHLGRTLDADRVARCAIHLALREGSSSFTGDLTPQRLMASISRLLVVPPLAFGQPGVPFRDHADVCMPGRDPNLVAEAERSTRHALLACGEPSMEEGQQFEESSKLLRVGRLPSMYALGIRPEYGVQYKWSPERQELGRHVAGKGARLELWRFVSGDDKEAFWRMVALVERMSQVTWTTTCSRRWEIDGKPGRSKAHLPESCAGLRALLILANAGIVDALRRAALETEFT